MREVQHVLQPVDPPMECAEPLDPFGQGAVVGDHDGPWPLAVCALLDGLDDRIVRGAAAGV